MSRRYSVAMPRHGKNIGSKTIQMVKRIIDTETEELNQYKLIADMMRESCVVEAKFNEITLQLEKLKQGMRLGIKYLESNRVELFLLPEV